MIEYSVLDLLAIADSVIQFCHGQKLSQDELAQIRVRLHPVTKSGQVNFEVGSIRPWNIPQ